MRSKGALHEGCGYSARSADCKAACGSRLPSGDFAAFGVRHAGPSNGAKTCRDRCGNSNLRTIVRDRVDRLRCRKAGRTGGANGRRRCPLGESRCSHLDKIGHLGFSAVWCAAAPGGARAAALERWAKEQPRRPFQSGARRCCQSRHRPSRSRPCWPGRASPRRARLKGCE